MSTTTIKLLHDFGFAYVQNSGNGSIVRIFHTTDAKFVILCIDLHKSLSQHDPWYTEIKKQQQGNKCCPGEILKEFH